MKIKKDFVTNSSSASFVFEDRRKNPKSLVVRFSGGCINLFIVRSGFGVQSFKNKEQIKEVDFEFEHYLKILNEIIENGNTGHVVIGENCNEILYLMSGLLRQKEALGFPVGVTLLKASDQGDNLL